MFKQVVHNRSVPLIIVIVILLIVGVSTQAQYDNYQIALERIEEAASSNATHLSLSRLHLRELPPEIGLLTNLQGLSLNSNNLTSLPPEIGHLATLQSLSLSFNNLTSLPPEIGQLTNLQRLDLSENSLVSLPPEIGLLSNLEILNLDDNALTSLPPEIGQLTHLKSLHLGRNNLAGLPAEIGLLTGLEFLDLKENTLTDLPPEMRHLTHLEHLSLAGNHLPEIPTFLDFFKSVDAQLNYSINPILFWTKQTLIGLVVLLIFAGLWFKVDSFRKFIRYVFRYALGAVIFGLSGGGIGWGVAFFLAMLGLFFSWELMAFSIWLLPYCIGVGVVIGIIVGLVYIRYYRTSRQNNQSRKIHSS